MLHLYRKPLLMAALVGAQGVCEQRMPCWPSQVAVSPVRYIMCAPAADDRQCKTGGKDMLPDLSWRQAFQQAEISTKVSGTSGHHSLLLGACFCSLSGTCDHELPPHVDYTAVYYKGA